MSRSIRFFEIIQILRQSERPIIASELAEKLEVNIRTVYRDIASLQASGVPIQGEAGIGYVMQKGFDLPPMAFSREELEAISVGLSMLGRSGDKELIKTVDTIRSKISSAMPSDLTTAPTIWLRNGIKYQTLIFNLKHSAKSFVSMKRLRSPIMILRTTRLHEP